MGTKTEAETFVELERLLEGLDASARKRAAEWIAAKYGKAVAAAPLAHVVSPAPVFVPVPVPVPVPMPAPAPVAPWPGQEPWQPNFPIITCETRPEPSMLAWAAERMPEDQRARFTMTAPSLCGAFLRENLTVYGPGGASLPSDVVFRSWPWTESHAS